MEFADFFRQVAPRLKGSKCPIKAAIGVQYDMIRNVSAIRSWDAVIDIACRYAKIAPYTAGLADGFMKNLSKGSGNKTIAVALYFYLHAAEKRKPFARRVDAVAFDDEAYFDGAFAYDRIGENELTVIMPKSGDIDVLGTFLNEYDVAQSRYPTLLILSNSIEESFETRSARIPDLDGTVELRAVLNQQNWIDPRRVSAVAADASEWTYDGEPLLKLMHGANHALVRADGTRVATSSLHRLHDWVMKLHYFIKQGVIAEEHIDLVLRHILILAGYRRSAYLKFYFRDDAEALDLVFRMGARRAFNNGTDLADYGELDPPYGKIARKGE